MRSHQEATDIIYKPLLFTICTFIVTWCCAGLMAKVDYDAHIVLFTFLDFMENASPLFCALILLRPYLVKKHLLSSIVVSLIWVFWHIPYFFISDSMQAGRSFLSYSVIGIITGFILTAIYLLTKSVLLCMLFHSWQNTIVMTIQADMSNIWFMILFILLGAISILLCMFEQKRNEI